MSLKVFCLFVLVFLVVLNLTSRMTEYFEPRQTSKRSYGDPKQIVAKPADRKAIEDQCKQLRLEQDKLREDMKHSCSVGKTSSNQREVANSGRLCHDFTEREIFLNRDVQSYCKLANAPLPNK